MKVSRLAPVLAVLALVGCAPQEEGGGDSSEVDERITDSAGWQTIGPGVGYKNVGPGTGVFIGFAGYSVQSSWSRAWVAELADVKLVELGVGHVYAVRGPSTVSYSNVSEVDHKSLAKHLVRTLTENPGVVVAAGHSSGAYVLERFIGKLYDGLDPDGATEGKVVFVNLDGDHQSLSKDAASHLKHMLFVNAHDPASGNSANTSAMTKLADQWDGELFTIESKSTGCSKGAKWCMHDVLVTTRPHDHSTFDLEHDYTDFDNHAVQTAWIGRVAKYFGDTSGQ